MVDVHKCTRLIEEERREGDTELGGNNCEAALVPLVGLVKLLNFCAPAGVLRLFLDLFVHERHVPVLDLLIEVRDHIALWRVHVDFTQLLSRDIEVIGNLFHEGLADEHTLRTAETTECRVRDGVGLRHSTANMNVGDRVDTIDMGESTLNDCTRQILTPATVIEDIRVKRLQLAILVHRDLPPSEEGMALSRCQNVFVSVEHTTNRSADLVGCNSHDTSELNRSCLFATEATTHTLDTSIDLIGRNAEDLRYVCLCFRWVLSAAEDFHLPEFRLRDCHTCLCLKVEVFLATHACCSCEDVISFLKSLLHISFLDVTEVLEKGFLLDSFFNRENGRHFLILNLDSPRCLFSMFRCVCKDHTNGLTGGENLINGEESFVAGRCSPPV